jgi:enamine deaminase RidA (YjgF/YER057c/UK114 family)
MKIAKGSKFPTPVGPYSPAAIASPNSAIAFIGGQVPADEQGKLVGIGDFRKQFRIVMENVRRALAALGATFEDVAYIRGTLSRYEDYPAYTEERTKFYAKECPEGPPPTTTVIVTSLYHPDCLLEVDAIAVLPPKE